MVFLDANAGEILRLEARDAMQEAWLEPGNPASVHAAGRAARARLESARRQIAAAVGGSARNLIFTSGGTESDALALHALGQNRRLLIGATEHDAVRAAVPAARFLPVLDSGEIDLDALEIALKNQPPALVALMLANNETGVLHPIVQAAAICHAHGALLFVDAAQALNRIPVNLASLGADAIGLSAHKAGAPKGAGALLFAADTAPTPLMPGGGQERGWRGGTQNLPAIAGFAAIAGLPPHPDHPTWQTQIAEAAQSAGAQVAGLAAPRLPNTVNLVLPGVRADLQLISLDLAGFAVSAGAACSSGKVSKSHVLEAMQMGENAGCAIRVSLSWQTTQDEVTQFIAAYRAMASRLRR